MTNVISFYEKKQKPRDTPLAFYSILTYALKSNGCFSAGAAVGT